MIRITIEVLPHGHESMAEKIGEVSIMNSLDHPRAPRWGRYHIAYRDGRGHLLQTRRVNEHLRSEGIWSLLKKVFRNMNTEEMGR